MHSFHAVAWLLAVLHPFAGAQPVEDRSTAATYGTAQVVLYNPSSTCTGSSTTRSVATANYDPSKTTYSPCYVAAQPFYSLELRNTSSSEYIREHCSVIWYLNTTCQGSTYGFNSAAPSKCWDARISSFGSPLTPAKAFIFQCVT